MLPSMVWQMQQECPLFSLSAEPRNEIYWLVFAVKNSPDEPINLKATEPPTSNLSTTCQRIHQESQGLYHRARREYFSREFTLAIPEATTLESGLTSARSRAVYCGTVTSLRIQGSTLLVPGPVYKVTTNRSPSGSYSTCAGSPPRQTRPPLQNFTSSPQ